MPYTPRLRALKVTAPAALRCWFLYALRSWSTSQSKFVAERAMVYRREERKRGQRSAADDVVKPAAQATNIIVAGTVRTATTEIGLAPPRATRPCRPLIRPTPACL
jgi:hypothetical protein